MVVGVLVAFAVQVIRVLASTKGHFTYTLDDPYIHLALADQIRHGHYGLVGGTPSSPSSSILWPFLLSLTAGSSLQDYMPLVWNTVFTLGSVLVLHSVLARHLRGPLLALVTSGIVLCLDLVGVAFTGMEHALQVLLALLVGRGVASLARTGLLDPLLVVGIVLGPVVRYENVAFSVAAAVALVVTGHRRAAAAATAAWLVLLGSFSLFLVSLGLDPMPSSVLAKAWGAPLGEVAALKLLEVSLNPIFFVYLLVPLVDAWVLRRWTMLHWFTIFVLVSHVVAGGFGALFRYEIYVLAGLVPVLVRLVSDWALRWSGSVQLVGAGLTAAALVSTSPMVYCTVVTPSAAADIWMQQAQTARFVRDYWRQPLAVNDLGMVAYRSGQPVLDLWGLASQEARKLRAANEGRWVGPLVRRRGVRAAAIYEDWFSGQIPSRWVRVATLTGRPTVSAGEQVVTIFATKPAATADLCAAMRRFAEVGSPARIDVTAACRSVPARGRA